MNEFSKNAYRYDEHTELQQTIAQYLLSKMDSPAKSVMDLGCGSGAVFKQLPWVVEQFTGVDRAPLMCELHPKASNVQIVCSDFEAKEIFENHRYDFIISSSALQWANNIATLVERVAGACQKGAFAIFTDKTFETLYRYSTLPTFLPHAPTLIELFSTHFACHYEIKTYQIFFDTNKAIFEYIKKSGVSGGQKRLSVAQTKDLMRNYPLNYLEFEVLFIWGSSKYN